MNRHHHEFDIDKELESANQVALSEMVRQLPEDEPSLEWRSQLNERLVAIPRKRKPFWAHPVRLAWVGGVATIVLVWLAMPQPVKPGVRQDGVLESVLVSEHAQTVAVSEIAGAGLNYYESQRHTSRRPVSEEWNESDLDTL